VSASRLSTELFHASACLVCKPVASRSVSPRLRDARFRDPTSYLIPTAQVQLARAYAIQGDAAKVRTAYQDFLALWKDADPDIPILKQAKTEYAKLR